MPRTGQALRRPRRTRRHQRRRAARPGDRPARPQRRGQVHADQTHSWPDSTQRRPAGGAWPVAVARTRAAPAHRLPARERHLLRQPHRSRTARLPGATEAGTTLTNCHAARPRRPGPRRRPAHRHIFEGHAPAPWPRAGAAGFARSGAAGRADHRPRPAGHPRAVPHRRRAARGWPLRAGLLAPAGRTGTAHRRRTDPAPGQVACRRQPARAGRAGRAAGAGAVAHARAGDAQRQQREQYGERDRPAIAEVVAEFFGGDGEDRIHAATSAVDLSPAPSQS